jgi:hypothetical protein
LGEVSRILAEISVRAVTRKLQQEFLVAILWRGPVFQGVGRLLL